MSHGRTGRTRTQQTGSGARNHWPSAGRTGGRLVRALHPRPAAAAPRARAAPAVAARDPDAVVRSTHLFHLVARKRLAPSVRARPCPRRLSPVPAARPQQCVRRVVPPNLLLHCLRPEHDTAATSQNPPALRPSSPLVQSVSALVARPARSSCTSHAPWTRLPHTPTPPADRVNPFDTGGLVFDLARPAQSPLDTVEVAATARANNRLARFACPVTCLGVQLPHQAEWIRSHRCPSCPRTRSSPRPNSRGPRHPKWSPPRSLATLMSTCPNPRRPAVPSLHHPHRAQRPP